MERPTFKEIASKNRIIKSYQLSEDNIDNKTVQSFGEEWSSFHDFSEEDIAVSAGTYFDIVTDKMINRDSVVIDIGCGSGRFIRFLKGQYKKMVGIDPSAAIFAADALIGPEHNVELIQTSADNIPYPDNYFDFGYSLGVLHHVPDTQKALSDCVKKIKPGGYFLLYLYYNLDNRSILYKLIFRLSNLLRRIVSGFPSKLKKLSCDILAVILYLPFVVLCRLLKFAGVPEKYRRFVPLQAYEDHSFYIIRNDALDRFGTPLEQRFSRKQMEEMMLNAGLYEINFSEKISYWHAVGKKR